MDVLSPICDELRCQPVLIQTIHATVDVDSYDGYYVEPGRDILLNYPTELGPNYPVIPALEGYICYEFHGDHHYRRLPDGSLTERLSPHERDHALEMDADTLRSYSYTLFPCVIGIDPGRNIYVLSPRKKEIGVYTFNKKPLAKFKVLGGPALQYLAEDGCLCVITDNAGRERKGAKNLIRIYRLELPKQNDKV